MVADLLRLFKGRGWRSPLHPPPDPAGLWPRYDEPIMSSASVSNSRWTNALLDPMRQIQDPAADQVVSDLFAAGRITAVNDLMTTLVRNDSMPPDQLPPNVRDFLARSGALPGWADARKIELGERVFWRFGPAIIAVLHCCSLPFCYAGRKGVQVLAL